MSKSISAMRGMTKKLASTLAKQKITNSNHLLDSAKTPAARKKLAQEVGVDAKDILALANRADLARVSGIGAVFSDLMEEAGVDTVKELSKRRVDNLYAKMQEVNGAKKLAKRAPTMTEVQNWVDQAKALPKMLTY